MLDRTRTQQRKFKRMAAPVLVGILGDNGAAAVEQPVTEPATEAPEAAPEGPGDEPPVAP